MTTPSFDPQPCCGAAASAELSQPMQFCMTSTAPVDNPGRQYATEFTLAQGFAVQSIIKDLVETPVNIIWEVTDADGSAFVSDLQTAIQSQFPDQTVTVIPGIVDTCTGLATFSVVIECVRLDEDPVTLLQLKYNAGRDLIINPAFLADPPTSEFAFMKREDAVSGVATVNVLCTDVANRGWENNDKSNSFETWGPPGSAQNIFEGTTPTPRGTVVQEINSYGSGATPTTGANAGNPAYGVDPDTIWQTFVVPAAGNFIIKVVVGGRATTENIPIKLSTGDTGAGGIGDVINTSVNAPQVTNEGGATPGPWTTFTQTVPLSAGTYTLAFTGPNAPIATEDNAFGGLFTDMRVYQDAPGAIENFTNTDDVCTVSGVVDSVVCEFWTPTGSGGTITNWTRANDGLTLTNAEFWAQVPAPSCCVGTSGGGGGGSAGNLVDSYLVCATLNGETRTMTRVVVTDQSGGIISQTFVDTDGAPVTPDSWQPGQCSATRFVADEILCDFGSMDEVTGFARPFIRKYVQSLSPTGQGQVDSFRDFVLAGNLAYTPVGPVGICTNSDHETEILCDTGNGNTPFRRVYARNPNGSAVVYDEDLYSNPYSVIGVAVVCPLATAQQDVETFILCDATPTRFMRAVKYDAETGAVLTVVNTTLDGTTPFVPVGVVGICTTPVLTDFDFDQVVLCDANGTAFIRRFTFNSQTGAVTATVNLTLAGAAFVPVGAVGLCSDCCPAVVGNGCTNTGSGFYTAIRNTNGTISLIDSVSGVAITGANIIPCPSDATVRTLTAQARTLTNGTPWTPGGDVVGTLTSLTVTGVSGLWDMVDQNGTALTGLPAGLSLTWSASDDNVLSGPTSVTPQSGASVIANWTVR